MRRTWILILLLCTAFFVGCASAGEVQEDLPVEEEPTAVPTEEAVEEPTAVPTEEIVEEPTAVPEPEPEPTEEPTANADESTANDESEPAPDMVMINGAPGAEIADTSVNYYLTSMYTEGDGLCLESNSGLSADAYLNGASYMERCQDVTGQLWKFTPSEDAGYYHLTSVYMEPEGRRLESGNGIDVPAYMDIEQNVTGQLWKLIESEQADYYHLTSMYMEAEDRCLESGAGAQSGAPFEGGAYMENCQNVTGQFWKLTAQADFVIPDGSTGAGSDSADTDTDTSAQNNTSESTSPPFAGTIFVDPNIITENDPTTFVSSTYTDVGSRVMFDRRVNDWITVDAFLFDAVYADGRVVEIQVNSEFGTAEAAQVEADFYAAEVGRLPAVLLTDLQTVSIHKGVELFGGGNNDILIHTGQTEFYVADGILEETLVHEASHTSLDAYHDSSPGWLAAQTADNNFISTYAQDNPMREDIAESFLLWMAIRYRADRIPESLEQTIIDTMPNRIDYFDAQNFDMNPIDASTQEQTTTTGAAVVVTGPVDSTTYCSDATGLDGEGARFKLVNLTATEINFTVAYYDGGDITNGRLAANQADQFLNTGMGEVVRFESPNGPFTYVPINGDCVLIMNDGLTVVPMGVTAMVETTKTDAMEQACGEIFDLNRADRPVSMGLINLTASPIDLTLQAAEEGQPSSSLPLNPDSTYPQSIVWYTLDGHTLEANFDGRVFVTEASDGNCLIFNENGSVTLLTTTMAISPTNEQICANILNPADGFSVRVRIANPTSSSSISYEWTSADGAATGSYEARFHTTKQFIDVNPGDVLTLNLPSGPFEYTVGDSNGCIVVRDDVATVVR